MMSAPANYQFFRGSLRDINGSAQAVFRGSFGKGVSSSRKAVCQRQSHCQFLEVVPRVSARWTSVFEAVMCQRQQVSGFSVMSAAVERQFPEAVHVVCSSGQVVFGGSQGGRLRHKTVCEACAKEVSSAIQTVTVLRDGREEVHNDGCQP